VNAATAQHAAPPPTRTLGPDHPSHHGTDTPADLAALMADFNTVTQRLEHTHNALRNEVHRLSAELSETRSQLERARELAALGEMAAGIAHEVRNPLGSIRLYAEALAHDLDDRPCEQQVATSIVSSVTHLNAVVGDVLAFARELKVKPEPVPATQLAEDAANACAHRAAELGVQILIKVAAETGHPINTRAARSAPKTINADESLFKQALVNIVRNAVEAAGDPAHAPKGNNAQRTVTITAEDDTLRLADGTRQPAAAVVVTDSGPGIPPDVLARIFNPFFTTRETGTGLGLAIVHRILDAHRGRVAIEPQASPTTGARVRLIVPKPAHNQSHPTKQPQAAQHQRAKHTQGVQG